MTPVSDLPQSQVDAIIRTKRKAREPKACYPCHARKVKCDRNLPCDGCVKRDHADLCSYERPSKKRIMGGAGPSQYRDSPAATPGRSDSIGLPGPAETPVRLKQEPGVARPNLLTSAGRVSIAREEWENVRSRLKEMEQTITNLRVGLEKAEEGQASSLETGSVQSGDASNRSKAASPEREGIHAANTLGEGTVHLGSRSVLAYILNNKSGSDQLQALLEGGILPKLGLDNESATYPFVDLWSSDMSTFDISAVCSALPSDQQCKEWSMAWQDSHFSLSYDRPSTTAVCQPEIAYKQDSTPGECSYFETLCRVISLALEVVRSRMLNPHAQLSQKTIQAYKERIQHIMIEAKPYLRDRKYCFSTSEHLERVVLKLHSSYFASELLRPALKMTADPNDPLTTSMRSDCVSNLMTTVEAYVEMHSVSSHASRSWIALQRAISSIFLLAVTEESKTNPRFWTLLREMKMIIAERANEEGLFGQGDASGLHQTERNGSLTAAIPPTTSTTATSPAALSSGSPASAAVVVDTQTQWAKPLTKTLRALDKLEAAFSSHGQLPAGQGAYLNPATASMQNLVPPVAAAMTPSVGSLPPPTPESSTSGEWTIPNILDRAAEYIHPPLWS
ncbi:hypothetical protein APSETT445_000996 [Aspergillus pseudonomiae]